MQSLTAILVDDIPNALDLLEIELHQNHPEITIIGKAKSVVEAAKLLRQKQADILFLDIMLGDGTGFDLLEIFPELNSKIIFVTASDEHAIRAFKFAAIDYVLKPFDSASLSFAIEKAKQQIKPQKEQLQVLKQAVETPNEQPKKISLHTSDKIQVVDLEDIIKCQSDNNYTKFYINNHKSILVTKTLKTYSELLKKQGFIRVHQSHLVNLKYVKEFIKSDGGYLVLKDNTTVPVSVRKRTEVIEALNSI